MTTITNPFMHFEVIKDYRQAAKVEHKLLWCALRF